MIIELAGLPGSGKSTLARLIREADPSVRVHVVGPSGRMALRHPFQVVLESTRPSGIGPGTGWPAWPKLWLRCQYQHLLPPTAGVDIFEEGVIHHVWRALFRRPSLDRAPWRGLLTLPHPLLVFETDRPVRLARIVGKPRRGRVNQRLTLPDSSAEWDRAEALMAAILAALPSRRPVIRVETSGELTTTLAQITSVIASLR